MSTKTFVVGVPGSGFPGSGFSGPLEWLGAPLLEQCRDGLERALAGLSPADAEVSTNGAWSIANIVEHLDLTYTRNAAGLERRLVKGDAPARARSVRQAAIRFVIVTMGYFPPRSKVARPGRAAGPSLRRSRRRNSRVTCSSSTGRFRKANASSAQRAPCSTIRSLARSASPTGAASTGCTRGTTSGRSWIDGRSSKS